MPQGGATVAAEQVTAPAEEMLGSAASTHLGTIDVTLPSGVQLSVDSFVNGKALARVLRALEHGA